MTMCNVNRKEQPDFRGQYETILAGDQEEEYQRRVKAGELRDGDNYDYDVRAFHAAGGVTDERGHGSDIGKKPNHPTFSDQSKYHGTKMPNGKIAQGGKWYTKNGVPHFRPGKTNLEIYGLNNLRRYMARHEKGVVLDDRFDRDD